MDGTIIIHQPDGRSLSITCNADSYRRRQVMGEHAVTLKFSLPQPKNGIDEPFVDIPVGAYIEFQGQRYTLYNPSDFQKDGSRKYGYTLKLEAAQATMADTIFINAPDGRTSFSRTARPAEFLEALVWNLNRGEDNNPWTVGAHLDAQPATVSFKETTCAEALRAMAEVFHTEWEVNGKEISLCKVEHFKDKPLALQYGKGKGFKPGVGRGNFDSNRPVHRLFVRGGERNIDFKNYGSQTLLLPEGGILSYDGTLFSDQGGELDPKLTRTYRVGGDRRSIERTDARPNSRREASVELTDIYPMREGTVTGVEAIEVTHEDGTRGKGYDFFDNTIPEALDYSTCRLDGETMTVVFQTGMLAGRQFEIQSTEDAVTGYVHAERRFKLVSQTVDGLTMPGGDFIPRVEDKYAVFGMKMPERYITDNEWNLFREAVRYKYENEEQRFTFKGELDPIYAQQNWEKGDAIGGKLVPGGYVEFSDPQFQPDGILIRISAIKEYLHAPYRPQLELSNVVIGGGVRGEIAKIDQAEVVVDDRFKEAISYTKRRFRDAEEHLGLIEQAVKGFEPGINPAWVHTMAMLLGDDNLQFRFLQSRTDSTVVSPVGYNRGTKELSAAPCLLRHMTLGTRTLSPNHDHNESEYRSWDMEAFGPLVIGEERGALYLYARCVKEGTTGTFLPSAEPIEFDHPDGHYYLLVGTLSSEAEGERSYVDCYGFTEILPGRITVGKIVDQDGYQFWDMQNKAFRIGNAQNNLSFNDDGRGLLRLTGAMVQSSSGGTPVPLTVYRGAWVPGYYDEGDVVTCEGTTYRAIYKHATTPWYNTTTPATDTRNWMVYVKKGEDGRDGTPGTAGKDGRIFSYTGDYSAGNRYTGNDRIAQVVKAGTQYFYTNSNVGDEQYLPDPRTDATRWTSFGANFESVATDLLFAKDGTLGSFSFNFATKEFRSAETDGISTPQYPNGTPNIVLNSQTGEAKFNNAIISGSLRTPFVSQPPGAIIEPDKNGNVYLNYSSDSTYRLRWDESQNGRIITVVMNGSGFARIDAETGYQFYENGKREGFIMLSRQLVRLMGFGTTQGFGGWIVIGREDFIPKELYGKTVKAMCYGRIDGTNYMSSAITALPDANYACFDDYYDPATNRVVHRSKLKVSRRSTGVYQIYFPSGPHDSGTPVEAETAGWNIANINTNYMVLCTGGKTVENHGGFASVMALTNTYFEVRLADDDTPNDGTFYFQMINLGGWL